MGGVGDALFACALLGDEPLWIVLQICTLAAMYAILAFSREGGHDGTHPCLTVDSAMAVEMVSPLQYRSP